MTAYKILLSACGYDTEAVGKMTVYEALLSTSGYDTNLLEEKAWNLYCEETAGDMDVRDFWSQLSTKMKIHYVCKVLDEFNKR